MTSGQTEFQARSCSMRSLGFWIACKKKTTHKQQMHIRKHASTSKNPSVSISYRWGLIFSLFHDTVQISMLCCFSHVTTCAVFACGEWACSLHLGSPGQLLCTPAGHTGCSQSPEGPSSPGSTPLALLLWAVHLTNSRTTEVRHRLAISVYEHILKPFHILYFWKHVELCFDAVQPA